MSGDEFVEKVLSGLGASVIVAGPEFRFGRDRSGDMGTLKSRSIDVEEVALVGGKGQVSSTAIRTLLAGGDVAGVEALLGRRFEVVGNVAPGAGRGAAIGFPTANLALDPSIAVPGYGVYAVRAGVGSEDFAAVANVGVRPTFDGSEEVVEVHLLDAKLDLYGRQLRAGFITRLREERRFESPEALATQIAEDVSAARSVHHAS